jgi:pimeloyl-ACP methyl ester carboxylesterase
MKQIYDIPLPGKMVEITGVKTNYYKHGSALASPLIMLHGMSASADSFREIIYDLGDIYWLVAPDIPGFGLSGEVDPFSFERLSLWLEAFLDRLGVASADFLGHSFGGALGVDFALRHEERVKSLILLAPSVLRPGKYPEWLRGLAKTGLAEKLLQLSVSASRVMLDRQMRVAFHDPAAYPESLWERRAQDYHRARASGAVLRALALHDLRPELHRIKQRSLVIWGEDDPVLDPEDARRLSDLMPHSRTTLQLLAACGHLPQIEQQEQVVSSIRAFLDSGAIAGQDGATEGD